MGQRQYREYHYRLAEDYDKALKINGERVRAYSPQKLRVRYPKGDYTLAGETFEKNKRDLEKDVGKIELADRKLYIAANGKHSRIFYGKSAFVETQSGEMIALLKRRLLPIVLAALILLGGIAGGIYGILRAKEADLSKENETAPHITPIEGTIQTISGRVIKEEKGIAGAEISLQVGNHEIGITETDENGNYLLSNVGNGYYNLVVTQGDSILTMLAVVNGKSIVMDCIFPSDDLHDIGEITGYPIMEELPESKETEDTSDIKATVRIANESTPAIAVGRLDTEAMLYMQVGKEADVTFTAEMPDENEIPQEGKNAIEDISGELNLTFYDFQMTKNVSEKNEDENKAEEAEGLTETKTVLEIVVPYDSLSAVGTYVFRYHENAVLRLEELAEKPVSGYQDGTYYVDAERIHIYTDCFSLYAIGSAQGSTVIKGNDRITYSNQAVVNLKAQTVKMLYQHNVDSTHDAAVQIYLTGETDRLLIAESGLIPVGYQIEEIPLLEDVKNMPSVGTYAGLMKILYYDEDSQLATSVEIPLSVAITQ